MVFFYFTKNPNLKIILFWVCVWGGGGGGGSGEGLE